MRIKVASADSFGEAVEVRNKLVEGFPEKRFQIRRKRNSFTVVERIDIKGKNRGDSL